ncbi:12873_t:CDS:2 [Gigaspora margarita]|uniref:12873_t:CDS:1 n=1 Tax=Gigaspora margarita TaxID=4874 RepID=A0ABN7UFT8_GIGMA|nr:12873_t:CDS:2 [Gigaspora margarita]
MSISNKATNIGIVSRTETCTCYGKLKPITEFTRMSRSRMAVNTSCNTCSDRDKRYRANKKAKSISNNNDSIDVDSIKNSSDDLLYNIHDIEELINIKFEDSKEKNEPVKFSVIVKLERELGNILQNNISQDNISQDNVLGSSIEPEASSSYSAITE